MYISHYFLQLNDGLRFIGSRTLNTSMHLCSLLNVDFNILRLNILKYRANLTKILRIFLHFNLDITVFSFLSSCLPSFVSFSVYLSSFFLSFYLSFCFLSFILSCLLSWFFISFFRLSSVFLSFFLSFLCFLSLFFPFLPSILPFLCFPEYLEILNC